MKIDDSNDKNINLDQDSEDLDKDLQKSLDDNLEEMNSLIKAKKTYSEDDMKEMMKSKKNRGLFKEYMKEHEKDDENDDENESENKNEKMKKSFENIYNDHDEIIDAVPVLKSFCEVLEDFGKKLNKIEKTNENLQKSLDDNFELQKSFGSVMASQSELIKSINEDIEEIGNTPLPVKGKVNQRDLFKSALDDNNVPTSKLSVASINDVKEILLKSFQEKEISGNSIAKWEQGGYNMAIFNKKELSHIESKLSK